MYPTTAADSISEDDEFSIGAFISTLYPRPSALVKQPTFFRYIKTTSQETLPQVE
jgi:hypothetical protein